MLIYANVIKEKSIYQVCACSIVSYIVIRQYLDGMYRIVPLIALVAYVTNNYKRDSNREVLNTILFTIGFLTNYVGYFSQEYMVNYLDDFQLIGATCFVFSVVDSSIINKALGNRAFNLLGKHSFEIYLVHQPITTSIMAWLCIKQFNIFGEYSWLVRLLLWVEYSLLVVLFSIIWKKTITLYCQIIQNRLILLYRKIKQL